jgi:hypothetical protein
MYIQISACRYIKINQTQSPRLNNPRPLQFKRREWIIVVVRDNDGQWSGDFLIGILRRNTKTRNPPA